jgi:hypothetical protein
MALPIAPTPVLSGKDSERFNKLLEKGLKNKVSKTEVNKGKALVEAVLKNATFKLA